LPSPRVRTFWKERPRAKLGFDQGFWSGDGGI
jgi:hypothetical protein